ncbi:MAG: endonuclease/exonuclease/phosphatase family protein, partial [Actinomycetota bacterium]|nr:endonuclease/exonuclease/phosphatase family protein [Actinomycetota bacterium]
QELGPRTAAVVSQTHPHGRLDPRDDFFGMGIAAKRPLAVERLPLVGRSGWVARLDPGDWPGLADPFEILNVHLANPVNRPWRATRDVRRRQIAQIEAYVAGSDLARVVIGDMNASPAWPEYRLLASLGVDAAAVTGTARRTWSHFRRGPRWLRIDLAFASGAVPVATTAVPVRGTDHHALVVELEV